MSDFAKLGGATKGGMTNLAFPLDVTSGPENGNHGHYVIFFVNAQTNAKIGFSNPQSTDMQFSDFGGAPPTTHVNTDAKSVGGSGPLDKRTYGTKKQQQDAKVKEAFSKPNRMVVKRKPTRKSVASISMYMPAQVATTYGAQYTDTQMGIFTGDALNIYDNITATGEDKKSAIDSIQKNRNRTTTNSINTYVTDYSWCIARSRWS